MHNTALGNTALYITALPNRALHNTALHNTTLHNTRLHNIVLPRPNSRSERLVEEALVMKVRPPLAYPTQIAKEARVVFSVRTAD